MINFFNTKIDLSRLVKLASYGIKENNIDVDEYAHKFWISLIIYWKKMNHLLFLTSNDTAMWCQKVVLRWG